MSQFLKGNFQTQKTVEGSANKDSLEQSFEREALRQLGGSIAFVSKKKFLWTGDDSGEAAPTGTKKD